MHPDQTGYLPRAVRHQTQGYGDVLQERPFADGESEWIVDLVFREPGSSSCQRYGAFPNRIDEVQVSLGKRSRLNDQGCILFAPTNRVVLDVEVLDDLCLVLHKPEGIQLVRMTNFDAFVELIEKAKRSAVEVGDDLNHNPEQRQC